jgi:uncharacterized YigZ family protein
MEKDKYTILNQIEVTIEERKSIFICNLKKIENESNAMEFINSIKGKYKDASHNVYAYITNNGISMRYSDDGEPSGTAGPPVLEVLKREGLNDVAAVVTRYFGGTLLGAGGLIRTYGASCKTAIDSAVRVKMIEGLCLSITCEYDKYGKVLNYIQNKDMIIKDTVFTENVEVIIICRLNDFEMLKTDIIEMMNGKDIINILEKIKCFEDLNGKLMEASE